MKETWRLKCRYMYTYVNIYKYIIKGLIITIYPLDIFLRFNLKGYAIKSQLVMIGYLGSNPASGITVAQYTDLVPA